MKLMRTLSALPLLALPLTAQVAVEANASVVIASQEMNKMVSSNNIAGNSFGVAVRIPISDDFGHRIHLNVMGLEGKTGTGLDDTGHFYNAKPRHLTLGWDITQQLGKNWSVFGGLMLVKWKQDDSKITNPDFGDIARPANTPPTYPVTNNTNNSAKGTKFGARVGAEMAVSKAVSVSLAYNVAEFNKMFNPSWFNFGVTYRFGAK